MEIKIGVVGKIISGDGVNSFIKVIDDAENTVVRMIDDAKDTDAFLILISTDIEFQTGFDDWVENKEILKEYFEQKNWIIQWLE